MYTKQSYFSVENQENWDEEQVVRVEADAALYNNNLKNHHLLLTSIFFVFFFFLFFNFKNKYTKRIERTRTIKSFKIISRIDIVYLTNDRVTSNNLYTCSYRHFLLLEQSMIERTVHTLLLTLTYHCVHLTLRDRFFF
jgi:hypothetical protein